jgi:Insertion element 4 transposase N-terminal
VRPQAAQACTPVDTVTAAADATANTCSLLSPFVISITVAAGAYPPGHLGELTPCLQFEVVDDVLAQTRTVQRRLRGLPSRVGVCYVLALGMFLGLGYARVWAKLTAGLYVPRLSEKALRDLRPRLGAPPLRTLFDVVAGPLAKPPTRHALRTVAFDGCHSLKVPGPQPGLDRADPVPDGLRWLPGPAGHGPGRDRSPLAPQGSGRIGRRPGRGTLRPTPHP